MDIRAISVLQEYIADMPEPRKKCKKQIFLQETYSRWAAEEILRCIQENKSRPPVAVVEEFKVKTVVHLFRMTPGQILVGDLVEVGDKGQLAVIRLDVHLVAVQIAESSGNRPERDKRVILKKRIVIDFS